jgi:diguanylate cyclase (GGDEF)-like protein
MDAWVPRLLSSRWTERQEAVSESELVIRTLYEVTSDYRHGFEHQIRRLLKLGCRRYDMEVGVVGRVAGQTYKIVHHVGAPRFGLEDGMQFELESTLCGLTVRAGGPVGFEHLARSPAAEHPSVAQGGVEAYIAVPLMVDEVLWGTLAFMSLEPRPRRYSMADVDSLQLMASWVSTEIIRRHAEAALREAKRKLEHVSRTDPLTGLVNRRALEDLLEDSRKRPDTRLVAVLVDADDFKGVNENFGHAGGDAVLQAIADRVRGQLRGGDVVGRIGGDEFMVLLSGAPLDAAADVAERIRIAVSSSPVMTPVGPCTPKISLGVVPVQEGAATVTEILKIASDVLKESKVNGKNQVCVARVH